MVVVAALGGVDLVAEEKANSTLGFLLTKPVSRGRIYFSKILVNSLALGAAFLPGNLLILLADQLKPIPILHFYQVEGPAGALCGEFQACFSQKYEFIYHSFDILPALWVLGLILMFGVGIVCLSGLVSIFARNTMQAILLTIPGLAVFLVIVINTLGGGGRIVNAASFSTMNPLTPLLLAGAIIVFFYSGLAAFRRKEF
jgi:ABC-type Na+ efflux pump permease subunit